MRKRFFSFKRIDDFVFKKIDEIQSLPQFQQFVNQLESLPNEQSHWAHQGLSYFLIALPFGLLFVIGIYNLSIRSDLAMMVDIDQQISQIRQKNREFETIGTSVLNPVPLNTRADFERIINVIINQKNINPSKIKVVNFERPGAEASIQKTITKITFEKLSSKEFSDLLHGILILQRIKIQDAETSLDKDASQIKGTLELLYLGKAGPPS